MTARRAAAAVVLAGVLASGLAVAPAATAAGAQAQLTVAPRNAGVLQPGRPLDVDVSVHNAGTTALPAGTLAFSLDQAPAASAAELLAGEASIAHPSTVLLGRLTLTKAVTPALGPGGTAQVRARISADDLDSILTGASGARRLFVGLGVDGRQTIAESAVVRMASDAPRIAFGTVVPLTAPRGTTGVVDVEEQTTLTAEDGAWTQALRAARAMPTAVLALDPAVIASVRLAGVSAPESAQQLLTDLAALPNAVVPLPYADGDPALQRAAGLTGSTSPVSFTGSTAAAEADTASTPSPAPTPGTTAGSPTAASDLTAWAWSGDPLLWPVPGTATPQLVAEHAATGPALLSAADLQDSPDRVASGPLAMVGGSRVLVADTAVSRLLATATTDGIAGRAALAPLAAVLATDAVTGATPSLLGVAGRGASGAGLARVLGLLQSQRWIRGDSLESMTGRGLVTELLLPSTVSKERAARNEQAAALVEGERRIQRLATAVPDPQLLVAPQRLALLGLLSAQWQGQGQGQGQGQAWQDAATTTASTFERITDRVSIVDPGLTTLTGSDGALSVSVQNGLTQPVTLTITASADNGRLRFTDAAPVRITVPAQTIGSTGLHLQTVANGPVRVTLGLLTADGAPIGASTSRAVTVQAGFDTIVAVVLLTLLGLLLALGVYRNVTRRRRPKEER